MYVNPLVNSYRFPSSAIQLLFLMCVEVMKQYYTKYSRKNNWGLTNELKYAEVSTSIYGVVLCFTSRPNSLSLPLSCCNRRHHFIISAPQGSRQVPRGSRLASSGVCYCRASLCTQQTPPPSVQGGYFVSVLQPAPQLEPRHIAYSRSLCKSFIKGAIAFL